MRRLLARIRRISGPSMLAAERTGTAQTAVAAAERAAPSREAEAGQTMTEYALLMAVVGGGFAYTAIEFLPNFIDALQRYYDGFYIILNMPFP